MMLLINCSLAKVWSPDNMPMLNHLVVAKYIVLVSRGGSSGAKIAVVTMEGCHSEDIVLSLDCREFLAGPTQTVVG